MPTRDPRSPAAEAAGWDGYAPLGAPNPWGNATIDWEVGYDSRPLDTERVALANLTRDWQEDQRAGASIPHVVGGRVVGDIPGFFVLQVERRSAPGELVVAFRLSRDLHAYVRFLLTKPESNDFYVNGSIVASSWNRGQAFVAMSRVRLEGTCLRHSSRSVRGAAAGSSPASRSTSCATPSSGSRSSSSGRAAAAGAASRRCARRGSAATGSGSRRAGIAPAPSSGRGSRRQSRIRRFAPRSRPSVAQSAYHSSPAQNPSARW